MSHKQTLSAEHQALSPCVRDHSDLYWQCDEDLPQRREMIIKINELLKQGMSNSSKKCLAQMPQVTHYLEHRLYRQAPSLEEYNDGLTLADRLHLLKKSCTPPKSSWQSDAFLPQRRKMIKKIIILLKKNGIDDDNLNEKKVSQMANHFEKLLYRYAGSFEEYNDSTTLMNRINHVSVMHPIVIMTQNSTATGKPTPSRVIGQPAPSSITGQPTLTILSGKSTPPTVTGEPNPSTATGVPTPWTVTGEPSPSTVTEEPTPFTVTGEPMPSTVIEEPSPSSVAEDPTTQREIKSAQSKSMSNEEEAVIIG